MKTTVKVFAIIGIVIGGLAILGSAEDPTNTLGFMGGVWILIWGIVDLNSAKRIK